MNVNMNLSVPALEKLVDYTASGIGSVAGPMLAPWKARREAEAKMITARGDATALRIQADAQAKARDALLPQDTRVTGALDISHVIAQRVQFQEEKRQANIESVVRQAAEHLGDKRVADSEPDHDWTARFFSEVQDVSSAEMQLLWARVLAGQVEREGSTSIRTLQVLRNLDRSTANLFRTFCSMCVFFPGGQKTNFADARVPSLGGHAGSNALQKYGLSYSSLIRLHEHGLIISDYSTYAEHRIIVVVVDDRPVPIPLSFRFQNRDWVLAPSQGSTPSDKFELHGVSLNESGRELSRVVDIEPADQFTEDLRSFLNNQNMEMTETGEAHLPEPGMWVSSTA